MSDLTMFHTTVSEEAIARVNEVLRSGFLNEGAVVKDFEAALQAYLGAPYVVTTNSATAALHLCLVHLGVGPGDEVIVPPQTFVATGLIVLHAGATPVFADVDRDSQNITAETIAAVLTPQTKAIICVHLAGWPCDMDPIMALAAKHGLFVIEDCAQAHGARYKGRPVGGIGHMGAWSFCQDKIMTTGGEGGMLTLNDSEWWSRAWSYKDHGKSWSAVYEKAHPPGFRWVHESFGTNWRMIEMQAVIGRIQLRRMPEWTKRRGDNARRILNACREFSAIRVPEFRCGACTGSCPTGAGCVHAQYKTYVFVRPERLKDGWTRDRIIEEINRAGVPCYQGSCSEVYLEKAFDGTGWRPETRLPVAQELGDTALMFLVHPTLTDAEIDKTCAVIRQVMQSASA